jgi:hypothetical protein
MCVLSSLNNSVELKKKNASIYFYSHAHISKLARIVRAEKGKEIIE